MTHYWWMHWFWITSLNYLVCEALPHATVHSNKHELTAINESSKLSNATEGSLYIPPITIRPTVAVKWKNITIHSSSKVSKPFSGNFHFHFPNSTKLNNSNINSVTKEMTVINQSNVTDINITDNQRLVNGSYSGLNHTDNLTYVDDVTFNQTTQNSERFGIELEDAVIESGSHFSAAGITGITLGVVVFVGVVCGVSYFLYRNRGFNRPQVLNDRCSNPDSSGYIDDASVRDNSEEMYSLDNDSFLNSLEAMTIQNYWTDTVKHTKL